MVLTSAQQVSFWVLRPGARCRRRFPAVTAARNETAQFVETVLFTPQTHRDNSTCGRQLLSYTAINFRCLATAAAASRFCTIRMARGKRNSVVRYSDELVLSYATAAISVVRRRNCKQITEDKDNWLMQGHSTWQEDNRRRSISIVSSAFRIAQPSGIASDAAGVGRRCAAGTAF